LCLITLDETRTIGRHIRTRDRPVAENLYLTIHKSHERKTSMHRRYSSPQSLSKRATVGLSLIPHGLRERLHVIHSPNFMLHVPCILELNCIVTNVMHEFLIYLSIYFCLKCFGLSFSPIFRGRCTTSAVVQVSWVWCQRQYLNHRPSCTPASEDGLKESPKRVRQK
jgi:hypothetical protein